MDGEMQDFGIVELRPVDIFLYEGEMLPKHMGLEVGMELVETHIELLKHPAAEAVVRHHAVFLLVLYHMLHQLHGGIVSPAIALTLALLGGNVHRLQRSHLRL